MYNARVREEQGLTRHRLWQGMILLALFGAVVYGNSLKGTLFWDDEKTIVQYDNSLKGTLFWDDEETVVRNVFIRSPKYLKQIFTGSYPINSGKKANFYRPVTVLSFLIDYQLWQLKPFGYHLTNVLLHICNAILLFLLFQMLFQELKASFLAGLLFLIHPVNSEVVNYVSSRTDLLYLVFILAGLMSYVKYRLTRRWIYGVTVLVSYLLATCSKEMGLVFPLYCMACEWFLRKDKGSPAAAKPPILLYVGFAAIFIAYTVLRATALNSLGVNILTQGAQRVPFSQDLLLRLLTSAKAWVIYIRLFFVPVGLHMDYDPFYVRSRWDADGWLAMGFFIGLMVWAISWSRGDRRMKFGVVWFLLGLLPVSGIIQMKNATSEHFVYLGVAGFFLYIAVAVWRALSAIPAPRTRSIFIGCGIGLLMVLGGMTIARNEVWADPLRFFLDVVSKTERSYRANNNAGLEYYRKGDYAKAEEYFKRALEIRPANPVVLNNLGLICFKKNDQDGEEVYYRSAIQLQQDYVVARRNLAGLYIRQKKYPQALKQIRKVLEYYPYDAQARRMLQGIPKEFLDRVSLPAMDEVGQRGGRQP